MVERREPVRVVVGSLASLVALSFGKTLEATAIRSDQYMSVSLMLLSMVPYPGRRPRLHGEPDDRGALLTETHSHLICPNLLAAGTRGGASNEINQTYVLNNYQLESGVRRSVAE